VFESEPAFKLPSSSENYVKPNVMYGPYALVGDPDIVPVVGKTICVLTAAAIALRNREPMDTPEDEAARQLIAATCFLAAGEARAALLLTTANLSVEARIHVRSIDEMLRRLVIYQKDHQLALRTYTGLDAFRADGLAKLSVEDVARIEERDTAVAADIERLRESDLKPPRITGHKEYERQVAGLSSFNRWAYSQNEHGTILALREVAEQMTLKDQVDLLYQRGDDRLILLGAAGMLQNMLLQLTIWGVNVGEDFEDLVARIDAIYAREQAQSGGSTPIK
jgi:hypothetical protein